MIRSTSITLLSLVGLTLVSVTSVQAHDRHNQQNRCQGFSGHIHIGQSVIELGCKGGHRVVHSRPVVVQPAQPVVVEPRRRPSHRVCDPSPRQIRKSLARTLEGTGATVKRHGDRVKVMLPNAIAFGYDQDRVRRPARRQLREIAGRLANWRGTRVIVAGHTDSRGSEAYNYDLSARRSGAVARVLTRNGVRDRQIKTRAFGETRPIADNYSAQGRALNRRVELTFVRRQKADRICN